MSLDPVAVPGGRRFGRLGCDLSRSLPPLPSPFVRVVLAGECQYLFQGDERVRRGGGSLEPFEGRSPVLAGFGGRVFGGRHLPEKAAASRQVVGQSQLLEGFVGTPAVFAGEGGVVPCQRQPTLFEGGRRLPLTVPMAS